MPKKMAILDDSGLVINVILCEGTEPETETNISYTDENPAYIGGDYVDGYFYSPQPYPSWDRSQGNWLSPVPKPDGYHLWNEELLLWESYEFDPT